jgi:hypothetical protein
MKASKQELSFTKMAFALLLIVCFIPMTRGQQAVKTEFQFNGYTNHWQNNYDEWHRYGNLFKVSRMQVEKTFLQSKVDIADDLGLPGLLMEEGFVNGLLDSQYTTLELPEPDALKDALSQGDVLAYLDPGTESGKKVASLLPEDWEWPLMLRSYQYGAPELKRVDLFTIEKDGHTLYAVSSADADTRQSVKAFIESALALVHTYDFHKGWFGARTLQNSVTCTKGHPLEVIGTGLNEGSTWFVFDGYMDFMLKDDLTGWMNDIGSKVVTDVGHSPIYGCSDYDDLQVQQLFTPEITMKYARDHKGYIFRPVYDDYADSAGLEYDGYLASEGNKEQIDEEDVPFILHTGSLEGNALNSMILFMEKGEALTRESMWEAILDRRATGVLEMGKMLGPASFRNPLQMLLLDRVFLEDYFGDRIDLKAEVSGNTLQVTVRNFNNESLYGDVEITLPGQVSTDDPLIVPLDIPVNSARVVNVNLLPGKEAMGRANALGVAFKAESKTKHTMAMLDLPPAISLHQVIYGHAPKVQFPVSVHNFTEQSSFPVEVQVFPAGKARAKYKETKTYMAAPGSFQEQVFDLELPAGDYEVKVMALGVENTSQLGVGKAEGKPTVTEVDLNGDGIMEYIMENDSVKVTLITTGARMIEYIVKSRNDNVFFKLWPDKPVDDRRPFRKRGFYPFGGFEDFLGQASLETHQKYHATVTQREGSYVQVKMWYNYFGNRMEKIFTLYGNTPLVEVRFAMDFQNYPETNMLGPQPILELGEKHWTEDVFVSHEIGGLEEYRMMPEKYYGKAIQQQEGWNAGYDTKEDVSFVGAYPVDRPIFLHMWMNHPRNGDAHYYYVEFQPWLHIQRRTISYFSYYMWAAGGRWENGLEELRERNLISQTRKK